MPLVTAASSALLLVGCSSGTTSMPMPAPTPTYTSSYVAPEPTALAPLTGESVAVGALTGPSIAAKVDNHWDARPQFGLERSDIVFEELVEGGLTRYVAIWQSDVPDEIGPVRSVRPMDPEIVAPFGGIIAYSGGQDAFVDWMRATGVYNAIHGMADTADTFYRTDLKGSPHDVVVRAPQVIAQHAELAPPAQQFSYSLDVASSTAAKDGAPTSGISLVFGASATPSWAWDAGRAQWLRTMTEGAPDTDQSGAQLGATNVVVLRVPVTYDYDLPKTELVGSGEAWISSGGATVHGSWTKTSGTDRIRLLDDRGVPVRLAPGNSWIELVPLDGAADYAWSEPAVSPAEPAE